MVLSVQEIQSKQFHVRFRGFDVEEVDKFLELVAESYAYVIEENKTLKSELSAMRTIHEGLKKEENSFKDALISAQKVSDEMRRKSQEEADRLMDETIEEIKSLKDEANGEIAQLEKQLDELKGMRSNIVKDLKGTLQNYLEHVDGYLAGGAQTGSDTYPGGNTSAEEDPGCDLYEKIDLPDVQFAEIDESEEESLEMDEESAETSGDDELTQTVPDLDSEIMFTLEDPLDNETVDLPIRSEEESTKSN